MEDAAENLGWQGPGHPLNAELEQAPFQGTPPDPNVHRAIKT